MGVPPIRAQAFTFDAAVVDQANRPQFRNIPTLAAGDVTVSLDGGAFNNITALPTANGRQVRVALSAAEMTADRVTVLFSDVAGAEWDDLLVEVFTDSTDIGSVACDVWACPVRTLTMPVAQMRQTLRNTGELDIWRGDTLIINFTKLGNIAARTNLWFTVKGDRTDADAASVIMIDESVGLRYINSAAATVAANGSITVTDAVTGAITVRLEAVEAAKLPIIGRFRYDIQMETATSIETLADNACCISGDITRET